MNSAADHELNHEEELFGIRLLAFQHLRHIGHYLGDCRLVQFAFFESMICNDFAVVVKHYRDIRFLGDIVSLGACGIVRISDQLPLP